MRTHLNNASGSRRHQAGSASAAFMHGLVFAVTGTLNLYLMTLLTGQTFDDRYHLLAITSFVSLFLLFGRYSMVWYWKIGRPGSIGTGVMQTWFLVSAALVLVGFFTRQTEHFPRLVIFAWLVTTPIMFAIVHLIIRHTFLRCFPRALRARSTLIVFMNPASRRLARMFSRLDPPQFDLLGFFEDREPERLEAEDEELPVLGRLTELSDYVNANKVEVVFVALPVQGADRAMEVVDQLGDTTASVYYVPDSDLFALDHLRFSEVGGISVLTLTETPFFGADGLLKRLMDIASAGLLLLCLLPLFAVVAAAIRLTTVGPVFFTQRRYGLDGQLINVHKFRTMSVTEDGPEVRQATRNDPRVTRVGAFLRRTSIDEWPQFWNVLKGEMSLVGPRPHAITHNEEYRKLVKRYMVRHKVKPGLTGLAQVNGLRGEIRDLDNMTRRIKYDLDYIQRWSPALDMRIIIQTVWIIFRDHEAY
ncbi:undecaprenyl-phosphate glucose phosphotransferase [Salinisphaera aquimarina]|uniref:Undecaprenyl-phosphate glucose phosphotransferase n=1 Tax=Salinisphaera aquimarina TaxID=2094031 RepID=A0ABV7ET13_9GAMM